MTHFLPGDDGEPLGVVDVETISAHGTRLAFAVAAHRDDPVELVRIGQRPWRSPGRMRSATWPPMLCASALSMS